MSIVFFRKVKIMKKRIYAIILAGGKGSRFKSRLPKQLHKINDKTVLEYSIDTFKKTCLFDKILVIVPGEWKDEIQKIDSDLTIIEGGTTRTESLINGVEYLNSQCKAKKDDIVVTHDAARPLVTDDLIVGCINGLDKYDACTVALQSRDSLIYTQDGKCVESCPDRSDILLVQTPQSFKIDAFNTIIWKYDRSDYERITEIGQIFVENGYSVGIIEGNKKNMKITDKEDLNTIKSFL